LPKPPLKSAIISLDEFVHVPQATKKVRFEEDVRDMHTILTRGVYSNNAFSQHIQPEQVPPKTDPKPKQDSKVNVGRRKNAGYHHAMSLLGEFDRGVDVVMEDVESVLTLSETSIDEVTAALEGVLLDRYIDDEAWVVVGRTKA
jgi:hypothetical protein